MSGEYFASTIERLRQSVINESLSPSGDTKSQYWTFGERTKALQRDCASSPAATILQHYIGRRRVYSIDDLLELCYACQSQCEDVRDRIYGVLSLSKHIGNHVAPDYSASPSEVCLDVFAASLDPSSTVERKSFVTFVRKLQLLLEDPFWDKDLQAFHPLHRMLRSWHLETMSLRTWPIEIQCSSRIVQIGPIIMENSILDAVTYLE